LIKFNLKKKSFKVIPYKGESPQVYRHAVACFGESIYLYGGDNLGPQSNLYKFDIQNNIWELIQLEDSLISPGTK
jgi:hypothetical protein